MIKISIIIPIYNVENYIEKCFESIIRQKNMYEVEIICIDDGSTDASGTICDQYAEKDKRFKVIHKKNEGVAVARNIGLEIAKGKYIAWIDPDDYISENWYEEIIKLINSDIDIIFFDFVEVIEGRLNAKIFGKVSGYIEKKDFINELVIDQKIQSQLWSKVIKKELYKGIKMPVDLRILEDFAVLHYIVERAKKIYYIKDKLYFYRIRNKSLTDKMDLDNSYQGYLLAKKRYDFFEIRKYNVSKLGYLLHALTVCNKYWLMKINKKDYLNKIIFYKICKKEINKNMIYILFSTKSTMLFKIRALAIGINILGNLLKIKGFLRNKFKNKKDYSL